jgi:hypothetical protein
VHASPLVSVNASATAAMPLGTYALCYSTDSGATWVMQTLTATTTITVALPNPPAATAVSALATLANCTAVADAANGLAPGAIDVLILAATPGDACATFQVVGATPSARSVVRLVRVPDVDSVVCATTLPRIEWPHTQTLLTWQADQVASAVPGWYAVCLSTDRGATFTPQDAVGSGSGRVWLRPPLATTIALISVTPAPVPVTPRSGTRQRLVVAGLWPSSTTFVAIVLATANCSDASAYLGAAGAVALTSGSPAAATVTVDDAFTTLVPRSLCYSTRGNSPAQFVKQALPLGVVAAPAQPNDVQSILPSTVVAGSPAQVRPVRS